MSHVSVRADIFFPYLFIMADSTCACSQELASAEHIMHRRSASGSRPASEPDSSVSYSSTGSSPLAIAKLSEDVMRGLKRSTSTYVPPGALGVEVKQATLNAQLELPTSPDPIDSANSSSEALIFPMRMARTVVPPASRPPVSRPVPRSKDPMDPDRVTATASPTYPPIQDSGNSVPPGTVTPPPPIVDSVCSGYFVEPVSDVSSFQFKHRSEPRTFGRYNGWKSRRLPTAKSMEGFFARILSAVPSLGITLGLGSGVVVGTG